MKVAINAIRVSKTGGGGTDHYITHLVNHLAQAGYSFDLYTFCPEHFPDVPLQNIKVPFGVTPDRPVSSGHAPAFADSQGHPAEPKDAHSAPAVSKSAAPSSSQAFALASIRRALALAIGDPIKMAWTQFIFPFHLIARRYDLVFSPSQIDALIFSPVPQVITVLDLIPFVLKLPLVKHGFYLRAFFPSALRRSAAVVAISENTKRDVVKFFGTDAAKISAVLLAKPELGGAAAQKETGASNTLHPELSAAILCVSGNHAHKNLPRLLEAFAQIRSRTNRNLVIAGFQDAVQQKALTDLAERLKLGKRLIFLGHASSADLTALYQSAEIFVFPSLYEGFGLPPLEALSYGLPVAVSKSSSLPEVVGDAGVYFDPESVDDMAEQILKLLQDDALRANLRRKAPEQARKFSWERTARETWAVFEKALKN